MRICVICSQAYPDSGFRCPSCGCPDDWYNLRELGFPASVDRSYRLVSVRPSGGTRPRLILEERAGGERVSAALLPKSRLREELPEALRSAAAELKRIREYIAFSAEDVLVRVPLTDILYVQRVDRKLVIHTLSQGILQNNQGIKEFFDSLHSDHFLFIDRGTFVNVDHIERIDRTDLTVAPTKERLAISRRQLKNVKESLARFWSL